MPRKGYTPRKELRPDPKYNSIMVARFVNALMRGGKKSVAERIMYDTIDIIEKKTGQEGLPLVKQAMNNLKPVLEVKSRRVGGATYQVPIEVRPERRTALALRWAIGYAKARPGRTMADKLADELIAASRNEGGAAKKREDTHRMAEANKAFAHYRW
jgi:small subunit ribosomal protein S7